MSWIKQNENSYIHDTAPFSIIKQNEIWYVVDSRDQSKAVPYDDIFNNPVYDVDFSSKSLLAKHFRAEGVNTPGTPGFSFQGDINSGFYRISEDRIGFSVGGIRQGEFGSGYGGFTGNIIQIIQGSSGTRYATSNNSFTTMSDGVSITPKYINSKFLIFYVFDSNNGAGGTNTSYDFARKIGSGSIVQNISGKTNGIFSGVGVTGNPFLVKTLIYLDSPTLTNLDAITYYLSLKVSSGGGTETTCASGTGAEFSPIIIAEVQQ